MQIATHVLGYNVSRFIAPVIRNIQPHVDKIYLAYPRRPFGYIPESRATETNPTSLEEILAAAKGVNLEVIEGDWLDEESMRNACLDRAKAEGFDWLLTQDADEFYTEDAWSQIKRALANGIHDDQFITTWYNFWKSSQYVLVHPNGDIKSCNAGIAVRCRQDLKFFNKRVSNATRGRVLDAPCYHYGYVMSDEEMKMKLKTWSHAQQVNAEKWFRLKWLLWNDSTRHLHPTQPNTWYNAVRFPLHQPDFAEEFALPLSPPGSVGWKDKVEDLVGDFASIMKQNARQLRNSLK